MEAVRTLDLNFGLPCWEEKERKKIMQSKRKQQAQTWRSLAGRASGEAAGRGGASST